MVLFQVGVVTSPCQAVVMTLHWWMHWFWVTTLFIIIGESTDFYIIIFI